MNAPLYTIEILRLAAELPDVAPLSPEDGRSELRSPTCGSKVAVGVQMSADRRVEALSLSVEACAFGQAAATIMARSARGRSRDEVFVALRQLTAWLDGESESLGDWPDLAALQPARARGSRHGAILLPFRALLAAVEDAGR